MLKGKLVKTLTTGSALAAVLVVGMFLVPPKGRAANDNNPTQDEKLKIEIGARIAPVPLTIGRKDSSTVYLGSYLVNAVGGCNDCHTNHLLPQAEIRTSASLRRSTRPNIWAAERHLVRLLHATSRRMPQVSLRGSPTPISCR